MCKYCEVVMFCPNAVNARLCSTATGVNTDRRWSMTSCTRLFKEIQERSNPIQERTYPSVVIRWLTTAIGRATYQITSQSSP